MNTEKEQIESNQKICDMFEKGYNSIFESLEKTAKKFNSKSVPLELIKEYQDIYIKNLRESMGVKEKKKNKLFKIRR